MKRLLQSIIIYGLGSIAAKITGIILLPLLTAKLTPEEYGIIGIMTMFSSFLNAFLTLGLGTSLGICYFDYDTENDRNGVVFQAFFILLIFSIFVILGFYTLRDYFLLVLFSSNIQSSNISYIYLLTLVATFFMTITLPFQLNLQFKFMSFVYVLASFIPTLIGLLITILLVVIFKRGVNGYFEGYLLTQFLLFLFFKIFNLKYLNYKLKLRDAKNLLKYGIPMIPSFFSLFIINQGNRFILEKISGIYYVGIFSVGYNLGMVMLLVVSAILTGWTPYFLSFMEKQEEAKKHFGKIVEYYLVGMGFIVLIFFLYSKSIILLFVNKTYLDAYTVVGFIALGNFFIGLYSLLLPPMYFSKEVKYVSLIQIISALLSIFINFIAISRISYIGAAIGYVVSYGIICFLTNLYNKYLSKSNLKEYDINKKRLIPIIIIYLVISIISLFPRNLKLSEELVISFFITFIIFLIILNYYLDNDEKNRLKRYISQFISSGV